MNQPIASPVRLVVAISSRALFDLGASHRVFETEGVEAYCRYQIEHEEDVLEPGIAFPMAKKLLALNQRLGERGQVELILLSRNSSDTGLRVFNSIRHYGLDITRAAFTGGCKPLQLCLRLRDLSLRRPERCAHGPGCRVRRGHYPAARTFLRR